MNRPPLQPSAPPGARPLRVLIIAEAANPEFVSVPLVGWSHARAIMQRCDAHLATQVRNRDAILRAGLREGDDFTAIDSERVAAPLYRIGQFLTGGKGKGWTALTATQAAAYYYFERRLWQQLGGRIQAGEFDLVHRITPLSPTIPSLIAGRCKRAGVPFIVGPLNGGVPWPPHFDRLRRKENEWLSYVRSAYKLLPGYRSMRKNAAAILVASRDTLEQVPERYRDKCFYLPENAIDPERFSKAEPRRPRRPLRAAFLGRLVPYKGPDMLLEAAAPLLRAGELTIEFLGDGPLRGELEGLIEKLELGRAVKLAGWVQHAEVQERLREADLLTFPSVREFGGGVVLEAMALGVVPVVLDYGGPGELVTPRTGFTVPIGTRSEVIERFRATLQAIVVDPAPLESMSGLCIRRAHEQFTWSAKAERTLELYRWLSGRTTQRPHFPLPVPDPDLVSARVA